MARDLCSPFLIDGKQYRVPGKKEVGERSDRLIKVQGSRCQAESRTAAGTFRELCSKNDVWPDENVVFLFSTGRSCWEEEKACFLLRMRCVFNRIRQFVVFVSRDKFYEFFRYYGILNENSNHFYRIIES